MAGKSSLLLAILFLTILARGIDPKLVEVMNLTVVEEGYVRAVGGELNQLSMNVSVPLQADYQICVTDRLVTKLNDGNSIVMFESNNPGNPFNYKVTSSVLVKARKTDYLPLSYQVGQSEMRYTQPTLRVQSEDAGIRELARSITENASDDFERISKLALWVNKQVTYDLRLAGELKDARWILDNKRGVCSEYSTLFIALCRSIGIPARFVSGVAYDEENGEWTGHSWAEVYIGRWIPVDPTWSEIGYLDAGHLEISKMLDNETFDNVYAITSQNARLEWSKPDTNEVVKVTINSMKEGEKNSDYQLEAVADKIGFGMKTVVFASLSSDDYRVVSLNLTPCTGNILSIDDEEKHVILKPNERRIVSWVLNSNAGLSSKYVYTCPLVINSDYLSAKQITIQVTSDAQPINFNGFVEKSEVQLGENQTVYVDVGVARKYTGSLYLTQDDYYYLNPITKSGRYSFSLQPKRIGLNNVYLATSLGGVKELQFKVTGPQGIGVDVDAPEFIPIGVDTKVYVKLTSNETDKSIRITASSGTYRQAKQVVLTGNSSFEFSFNINDSKVQNITVVTESGGFFRELVKPVTVYRIPSINFTKKLSKLENGSVRTDLIFSGFEDVRDISIAVDDHLLNITQGNTASVLLTPGVYAVNVNYSDMSGAEYTYRSNLLIPTIEDIKDNKPQFGDYISLITSALQVLLYFGLVLILLAAVLILKKIEKRNY